MPEPESAQARTKSAKIQDRAAALLFLRCRNRNSRDACLAGGGGISERPHVRHFRTSLVDRYETVCVEGKSRQCHPLNTFRARRSNEYPLHLVERHFLGA